MDNRKLSEEAGLDPDVYTWNQIQLERFAELVAAAERESCAKLCEQYQFDYAKAIRARGDEMKDEDDDIQEYKKPWVGLSDAEVAIYSNVFNGPRLVREIESQLKERNT